MVDFRKHTRAMKQADLTNKPPKLTREMILAMDVLELELQVTKEVLKWQNVYFEDGMGVFGTPPGSQYRKVCGDYRDYERAPRWARDSDLAFSLLRKLGCSENWFGDGLFIAPMNNGKWVCGPANHIYNIKITDDHSQDKRLVIAWTAPEAVCRMRLIMATCPEDMRGDGDAKISTQTQG